MFWQLLSRLLYDQHDHVIRGDPKLFPDRGYCVSEKEPDYSPSSGLNTSSENSRQVITDILSTNWKQNNANDIG